MAEVLGMQTDDDPETPGEEKASSMSYSVCRNSRTSQVFCIRW